MHTIMERIDRLLNSVTMYRLLIYILGGLIALSLVFSLSGILPLSPLGLILTAGTVLGVGYISNQLLAWLYRVPANQGSGLITSLILICILPPVSTISGGLAVAAAVLLATASKYILVFRKQHIFNPAAAGAIAVGLLGLTQATWWIGNPTMLPFVLLGSLLVLRKLHYFHLAGMFMATALLTMVVVGLRYDASPFATLASAFTSWPLVFFAGFMLTEPSTMPPGRKQQLWFGALIGLIFGSQLSAGPLSTTPEIALAAGNLAFFLITPKRRTLLGLKARHAAGDTEDIVFSPDRHMAYKPGQYMDITLPDDKMDGRGNRRTFSIASAPSEETVRIGVKYYEPSSTFKHRLRSLKPGDTVWAGQVGGDFTLPGQPDQKLLFIAGGVGITPFRSMLRHMIDSDIRHDVILLYMVNKKADILYAETLDAAARQGMTIHYVLPQSGQSASQLTAEDIRRLAPDYRDRLAYIAGPDGMVRYYKHMLKRAGLSRRRVITDYFSGY